MFKKKMTSATVYLLPGKNGRKNHHFVHGKA